MGRWPPQALMAIAGLLAALACTVVGAWTTSRTRLDCVSSGDGSIACEQVSLRWFRLYAASRIQINGVARVTTASIAQATYRAIGGMREERIAHQDALALLRGDHRLAVLEGDPYSVEQARSALSGLLAQGRGAQVSVSLTRVGKTWLALGACLFGLQFYGWREATREWRRRRTNGRPSTAARK